MPSATHEEEQLAEPLTLLVEQFEKRHPPAPPSPLDALKSSMEDRGLRQRNLIGVFGPASVASEVINGKRAISKGSMRAGWRNTFRFP